MTDIQPHEIPRNHEITEAHTDDSPHYLTVQERQLRFRDEIEHARCSTMTHAERERLVRYVKEFVNLIYYPPSEHPGILVDETGFDVGPALDERIAEAAEAYYGQLYPRIEVSTESEIGEYE